MTKINKYADASTLWLNYKDGIRYYIVKKVKNEEVANDLSHEVLMKLYNSCCSNIEIKNVRSWMFQIAHNTTVDYLKKEQKFVGDVPEISTNEEDNTYRESENLIKPLIQFLPEKYAVPLYMADIEELSQAEVSLKLNLSLTATKSRIQRARKLLKEMVVECCNLETDANGNLISLDVKNSCTPLKKHLTKNND